MIIAALLVVLGVVAYGWRVEYRRANTTQRALDSLSVAVASAEAARVIATRVVDTARAQETKARGRLVDAFFESYISTNHAAAVANDTAATIDTLRAELRVMITSAERMRADAMAYQRTIDTLLLAHLAEREAWLAERAALTTYQTRTEQALAETRCRIGGISCPSRWQSFGVGVVVALTIAIVL